KGDDRAPFRENASMNRSLIALGALCLPVLSSGCSRSESVPLLSAPEAAPEAEDDGLAAEAARPAPDHARDVAPPLAKDSLGCHRGAGARGSVALDTLHGAADPRERRLWERVADALRSGAMPPAGKPRPAAGELDTLNAWLDAVARADCGE